MKIYRINSENNKDCVFTRRPVVRVPEFGETNSLHQCDARTTQAARQCLTCFLGIPQLIK